MNNTKTILETLSGSIITKEMQSIPDVHLKWVWDQFNLEYIELDNWLKDNYPKREKGKTSKEEYQLNHKRHLKLGEILKNTRICSSTWFEFGKSDYVQKH